MQIPGPSSEIPSQSEESALLHGWIPDPTLRFDVRLGNSRTERRRAPRGWGSDSQGRRPGQPKGACSSEVCVRPAEDTAQGHPGETEAPHGLPRDGHPVRRMGAAGGREQA